MAKRCLDCGFLRPPLALNKKRQRCIDREQCAKLQLKGYGAKSPLPTSPAPKAIDRSGESVDAVDITDELLDLL